MVGRAIVGAPVPAVDLSNPAGHPPRRLRRLVSAAIVVLLVAVGVPLLLSITRPSGRQSLPLPLGIKPPVSGSGHSGPSIPTPASPEPPGGASSTPTGDSQATGNAGPAAGPAGLTPVGGRGGAGSGGGAGPSGAGQGGGAGPGGASGATGAPGGTGTPPTKPTPTSRPTLEAAPLHAAYETVSTGLLGLTGYRGQVSLSNPGQVDVSGWTVTISLPSGEHVTDVSGARYRQSGTLVTFTPTGDTQTVPARGSTRFTFVVTGLLASQPTGCAIDNRPCD
jgi:hypothetical protein